MVLLWFIVWALSGMPHVEWFSSVWNDWGISLLISIILL